MVGPVHLDAVAQPAALCGARLSAGRDDGRAVTFSDQVLESSLHGLGRGVRDRCEHDDGELATEAGHAARLHIRPQAEKHACDRLDDPDPVGSGHREYDVVTHGAPSFCRIRRSCHAGCNVLSKLEEQLVEGCVTLGLVDPFAHPCRAGHAVDIPRNVLAHARERTLARECHQGGRVLAGHVDTLESGGGIHRLAGIDERAGLSEDPRIALGTPGHHDAVDSGALEHRDHVTCGEHIARADHGNLDRGLDRLNRLPVGAAFVELRTGPAVDAHRRCTGGLHRAGELHRVALTGLPPAAELHGDRQFARRGDLAYDRRREFGSSHERGTAALADDLAHRASHVDVDERHVSAVALHDADRLFGHDLRIVAEELDGAGYFLGREGQQGP